MPRLRIAIPRLRVGEICPRPMGLSEFARRHAICILCRAANESRAAEEQAQFDLREIESLSGRFQRASCIRDHQN